jgi:hypothetical protein
MSFQLSGVLLILLVMYAHSNDRKVNVTHILVNWYSQASLSIMWYMVTIKENI